MDNEFAKASLMLLAGNLVYALAAVVLGVICLKLVDHFLLKKIDLEEEIKKGNEYNEICEKAELLLADRLVNYE
jgi:hypothetical protein